MSRDVGELIHAMEAATLDTAARYERRYGPIDEMPDDAFWRMWAAIGKARIDAIGNFDDLTAAIRDAVQEPTP